MLAAHGEQIKSKLILRACLLHAKVVSTAIICSVFCQMAGFCHYLLLSSGLYLLGIRADHLLLSRKQLVRIVRFSHLLQRLYFRYVRGLLYRPVMLLLWDARPDISIMGSSRTSLARSAVAHGERRSGLLEKIASGGRSKKTGRRSMSGKVGSRLFLSGLARLVQTGSRESTYGL